MKAFSVVASSPAGPQHDSSPPLLSHGAPGAVRLVPEGPHAAPRAPIQRGGRLPRVHGKHEGALREVVPDTRPPGQTGLCMAARWATCRLLRSSISSRRTGTTVGSTSGQMLGMSGSTPPVCGASTVVNTTCKRSRLRVSSVAPEYLANQKRQPGRTEAFSQASNALQIQLQISSSLLPRSCRL